MSETESPATAASILECQCCFEKINPADQFCKNCGFPIHGTQEQQNKFIYERGYKKMQVNELTNKASKASLTFYIISGITLLSGLVMFFADLQNENGAGILIINAVIAILFLLLGVWSNKKPVGAIICGLSLYGVIILLQAVSGQFGGIVIKVLIIAGLIRALLNALEAERIKKQHNI
jgi:hypothetical protein